MATVELEDGEWQQVITALAMSNPLVVKIATQLQRHQAAEMAADRVRPINSGKEATQ